MKGDFELVSYGYGYDENGNPIPTEELAKREEQAWSELIEELLGACKSFYEHSIHFHWKIGEIIASASDTHGGIRDGGEIKFQRQYGKRNMSDISDELRNRGLNLSVTQLYQAVRFYRAFPEWDTVQKYLDDGVTLSVFRLVSTRKLPESERSSFLRKYAKGEMTVRELQATISDIIGTAKSDTESEDVPPPAPEPSRDEPQESASALPAESADRSDDAPSREVKPKNVAVKVFMRFEGLLEKLDENVSEVYETARRIPEIPDIKDRGAATGALLQMHKTLVSTVEKLQHISKLVHETFLPEMKGENDGE